MSLPKFTENVNNVSSLSDKPSMSAAALKAVFDKAGVDIKEYINEILLGAIEDLCDSLVVTVENSLTSTSTTNALAAAKGKDLNDSITALDIAKQKKITVGTATPTGGSDGDIYIQYF